MAKTSKLIPSLHPLTNFLLFVFICEAAKATGLSIKLMHRDSIESPLYPGNLTRSERIRLHIQSASAYATWLSNVLSPSDITRRNKKQNTTSIRPKMENQHMMYIVETGIGTFPPPHPSYSYFLHLDTANDLTWTQCKECRKMGPTSCFLQAPHLFPADRSTTYRPLPCSNHRLCIPGQCINTTCSYIIRYADGATTLGYLASESLTFHSGKNKNAKVKKVVFGCGIQNQGFVESSKTNLVAGNFGLGPGKFSFLTQKKSLTQGRFSYCLPPWDATPKTTIFLRFGGDIPRREGLKVTPLYIYRGISSYFVKLKGISVGNIRLDIPPSMLARKNKQHSGCFMDSGSAVTTIPPQIYGKLRETLMKNHFSGYEIARNEGSMRDCFMFPIKTGLNDLPNITFHLRDADMVLPPRLAYISGRRILGRYFCLAMIPDDDDDVHGVIIIGALQQANTRFIFDTVKRKLYFGPEDCSLGA